MRYKVTYKADGREFYLLMEASSPNECKTMFGEAKKEPQLIVGRAKYTKIISIEEVKMGVK